MKIFFAWQSDLPAGEYRNLIREALDAAIAKVSLDLSIEDAERDEALKGESGMVDIAPVIARKIAACTAFVADVTPVIKAANDDQFPNPNVLFELGFAQARPGQDALIAVLNRHVCEPKDLPFDIAGKRVAPYTLAPNPTPAQRKAARNELISDFTSALTTILGNALKAKQANTDIVGVEADPNYPPLWKGAKTFELDNDGGPHYRVRIPSTHKWAYLRVIPAAWSTPGITTAVKASANVWPTTRNVATGNRGTVDFGYLKVWNSRDQGQNGAHDILAAAAFHEQTGEWWFFDQASVYQHGANTYLDPFRAVMDWRNAIRSANQALDALDAPKLRRIIVGVDGVRDALWPNAPERRTFRKDSMRYEEQRADWNAIDETAFLRAAYNRLLDGFSQDPMDEREFDDLLTRHR